MAQVECPDCGTIRTIPEGKKKNCRKCGRPLTANTPAKVSAEKKQRENFENSAIKKAMAEGARKSRELLQKFVDAFPEDEKFAVERFIADDELEDAVKAYKTASKPLEKMSVAELTEYARSKNLAVNTNQTKAQILSEIQAALKAAEQSNTGDTQ